MIATDPAASGSLLSDIRVLELGGIGAVPFCAMVLADLGADVIRVHRPNDIGRAPNPVLDRGRRSIVLDLKSPAGADLARSIIDHRDVVLEGFRPGVAERLGFAPAELRLRNRRLVFGRMTGFGQDGPLASAAGHDINYIALSGALAAIGCRGQPPTPPLNLVGDFGGGGMLLAVGVLAAVLSARDTGQGHDVDASMVEGSALLMAMFYGLAARGSWSTARGTNLLDSGAPFYATYECSDGGYVAVGALEPHFYISVVNTLGVADDLPAGDRADPAVWPAIRNVFARAFARATRAEWVERFAGSDACVTPVLDLTDVPRHPHNLARGSFPTGAGGVIHPAPAPRFNGRREPIRPTPTPGQHTEEVLAAIGVGPSQITKLRADGVIG